MSSAPSLFFNLLHSLLEVSLHAGAGPKCTTTTTPTTTTATTTTTTTPPSPNPTQKEGLEAKTWGRDLEECCWGKGLMRVCGEGGGGGGGWGVSIPCAGRIYKSHILPRKGHAAFPGLLVPLLVLFHAWLDC